MSVTFSVRVESRGHERLNRQLNAFSQDVKARQKHARTIGGYVAKDAKANIRQQKTFDGQSFSPRKVKRKKSAMLRGLAKRLAVISMAGKGGGAIVSWRNGFEAGIAGRQQWGLGEDWTAERAKQVYGSPDYDAPCTEKQAKALIRAGYRQVRKGKPAKRINAKQIQESFTLGRAGLVLRMLTTGAAKGKQSWRDDVPPRAFLGVSDEKARKYSDLLTERLLKSTKQGKA